MNLSTWRAEFPAALFVNPDSLQLEAHRSCPSEIVSRPWGLAVGPTPQPRHLP
jgi:hypothetical protein